MKIGKYIIEIVPNDSIDFTLGIPYSNGIYYDIIIDTYITKRDKVVLCKFIPKGSRGFITRSEYIKCKHIKPNTGIRYSIIGKYWIFLIIKQLN